LSVSYAKYKGNTKGDNQILRAKRAGGSLDVFQSKYKGNAKENKANAAREARRKISGVFMQNTKEMQRETKQMRRAKRAGKL